MTQLENLDAALCGDVAIEADEKDPNAATVSETTLAGAVQGELLPPAAAAAAQYTTDINTAALQILAWARELGVLAPDSYYPKEKKAPPTFDDGHIDPVALQQFRAKQIRFLAIDAVHKKISIYFRRAAPSGRALKSMPKTCNGYELQYHQGAPENVSPAAVAENTNACAVYVVNGTSFYTCGSSISVGNNREAGTLGCLVKDCNGKLFGLSNNHVSGSCCFAPLDLPVIAPGIMDVVPGNPHPFTIGLHKGQLPMEFGDPTLVSHLQNSDAAWFEILDPSKVSSMQRGFHDTPSSVLDPVPGMLVQKVGRTTGLTNGVIVAPLVGPISISYAAAQYGFTGSAYFENVFIVQGLGDLFSDSGDSGSLVTHRDQNGDLHAVGLLFAGCGNNSAPGGKITFILPLHEILNRLNVSLVSGHNC